MELKCFWQKPGLRQRKGELIKGGITISEKGVRVLAKVGKPDKNGYHSHSQKEKVLGARY